MQVPEYLAGNCAIERRLKVRMEAEDQVLTARKVAFGRKIANREGATVRSLTVLGSTWWSRVETNLKTPLILRGKLARQSSAPVVCPLCRHGLTCLLCVLLVSAHHSPYWQYDSDGRLYMVVWCQQACSSAIYDLISHLLLGLKSHTGAKVTTHSPHGQH